MERKKAKVMFIRPTWAEINLDNIAHNIQACRAALPPDTRLLAVVKANGYGHGAVAVAKKALATGAAYLAVATADEGIELRDHGIEAPILILGFTPQQHASLVVSYGLTQTVYQAEMLQALGEAAQRLDKTALIHVKVDTGMGRLGFTEIGETVAFLKKATQTPGVLVEGMYTHLATSDELDSPYAQEQIMRWQALLQACEEEGISIPLVHISNSAAILQYPECAGNMVRLGISMYGYYPSDEVPQRVELRPALRLVSQIAHLKTVPAGTRISYGGTFETKRESLIATVPIGYADGYSRQLSGKGEALVGAVRVPVIGRVCMDQLMLDVTDVPDVRLNDQVVLYGRQGAEAITVDEVAAKIGTISYEVCCDLGKRVPRCYLEQGKTVSVLTM